MVQPLDDRRGAAALQIQPQGRARVVVVAQVQRLAQRVLRGDPKLGQRLAQVAELFADRAFIALDDLVGQADPALDDLQRLEDVARPLAEQIREGEKIIDLNVHERLQKSPQAPASRILLPERSTTQTEIDAFTPSLIELTPHGDDQE